MPRNIDDVFRKNFRIQTHLEAQQYFDDDVPLELRPIPPGDFDLLAASVAGFKRDPDKWQYAPVRAMFWLTNYLHPGWHNWYRRVALRRGYKAHMSYDAEMGMWVWHSLEKIDGDALERYEEKKNSSGKPIKDFVRSSSSSPEKSSTAPQKVQLVLPDNFILQLEEAWKRSGV